MKIKYNIEETSEDYSEKIQNYLTIGKNIMRYFQGNTHKLTIDVGLYEICFIFFDFQHTLDIKIEIKEFLNEFMIRKICAEKRHQFWYLGGNLSILQIYFISKNNQQSSILPFELNLDFDIYDNNGLMITCK